MEAQFCNNCKFWKQEIEPYGLCRRHAPKSLGSVYKGEKDKLATTAKWPQTQNTDWCGEWQNTIEKPMTCQN